MQTESVASANGFSSNIGARTSMELHQNLNIIGNIVVESGTYLVENTNLNLTGGIIASNDAAVIVRNSTLLMTAYESIVLADESKFIAESTTILLNSTSSGGLSRMIVGDETTMNITDSELYGQAFVIGRQNSRTYVKSSILKGPSPLDDETCGVLTRDNSTATIQDSELDTAQAAGNSSIYVSNSIIKTRGVSTGGNGLIEIENSRVGTAQWLWDNSTLRVLNSTIDYISFRGKSLIVRDSRVIYGIAVGGNSTAWLTNVSASDVAVGDNATVWLINSYAGAIDARDQGRAYVGWQLPLFGIITLPHTWLPILQGLAFLAALVLVIALLVFLNRRWKKWQLQKLKKQSQQESQS